MSFICVLFSVFCVLSIAVSPLPAYIHSMPEISNKKLILRGLAGIVFALLGFLVLHLSPHRQVMHSEISISEIIERAESVKARSSLADMDLPRNLSVADNNGLARYAQLYDRENSSRGYSPLKVTVNYVGDIDVQMRENGIRITSDTEKDAKLSLTYDSRGVLRGFTYRNPLKVDSTILSDSIALEIANSFLKKNGFNFELGADNEEVRDIKRGVQSIQYLREMPLSKDLMSKYTLKLVGKKVAEFENTVTIKKDVLKKSDLINSLNTGSIVLMVVIWLLIFVIMMIQFFRRLRHDEIEFRRAVWVGLIFGVLMLLALYGSTGFKWDGLLGGVFAGGFFGGLLMLLFAVSDAYCRDHDPQKIALSDLLLQGHLRIRETGHAVLNGFWIAGATFLAAVVIGWLLEEFKLGYFIFNDEDEWVFNEGLTAFSMLDEWLPNAAITTLTALVFAPLYLRNQLKDSWVLRIVLTIVFAILSQHLFQYEPRWIAFLAILPVAWYWSHVAYKYDMITLLLTLLILGYLLGVAAIRFVPDGYLNVVFISGGVLATLLFIAGIFFAMSPRRISDYANYVPPYVSQMAEKQRVFNELEIARNIQSRFLPQVNPTVPGLAIASICRPANEVGGDYYDFVHNENKLHVIVGDVSGKGVSAAFYMTMTKGIVKTLAKSITKPSQMLSEINEVFYQNTPRNIFISLLYGVFDMKKQELRFARAGHNPLLVWKASGSETSLLSPGGLAIGMDGGDVFRDVIQEQVIPFESGDTFVFYTDGISESMNAKDEEYGEERLTEVLKSCKEDSAEAVLQKINTAIGEFTGDTPQHDDFTMVVIKVDDLS